MDWTGTIASATYPILSSGQLLGYITASVTEQPERLTESDDLEPRLRPHRASASIRPIAATAMSGSTDRNATGGALSPPTARTTTESGTTTMRPKVMILMI